MIRKLGREHEQTTEPDEFQLRIALDQQWGYEVRIPSRTLKGWDWQYGIPLNLLLKKRHLQKGRNYTTLGMAQGYHVLTIPQTPS